MELLRSGDERALGTLVAQEPRATRFLLGRLWDPDDETRRRAARALGVAASSHPKIGVDVLRRLMWTLNDESATNGLYGIPAIAEIGFNDPDMVAPFVAPLASIAWDDGLRLEIIRALARIAEAAPELVRPVCARVDDHVRSEDPIEQIAFDRLLEITGGDNEA